MVRRLKIAATSCAVAIALLAVVELVVRAARPPPVFIGLLPFDPELGYRGPSDYVGGGYDEGGAFRYRLNSLGFRGPELPAKGEGKVVGRTRVLFVGDSFMSPTLRDEDIIQSVCMRGLDERGIPAEAFTVSCNDYGTAQELILLEDYGERVRPDVIVLEVFPGNDVANNSLELAGQVEVSAGDYIRPYFVPTEHGFDRTWAQPVRAFLRAHLRSFALLDRALIARAANSGTLAWYSPWPLEHLEAAERLRAGLAPAEWLELFRSHAPDHPWEHAWRVTEELLRAFADRARLLGARLLVLVVPSCTQAEISAVAYRQQSKFERGKGGQLDAFDYGLPELRLEALFREAGIEARFLLGPLREAARGGKTSYSDNGHLNARGSSVAGAVVADWIAGGDGFPSARTGSPPIDEAVRILPPDEEAPRRLDLDGQHEPILLGKGWLPLLDPESGRLQWGSSLASWMLMPVRSGDRLVVTGWLPPQAALPSTLRIQTGKSSTNHALPAPGTFQAELVVDDEQLAGMLTFVELDFSSGFHPTPDDWRSFGAFITQVELRGSDSERGEHRSTRPARRRR